MILLTGWALRTHDLDARSLWADEGWTMVLSQGPGLDDVTQTLAADQHPPLFFGAFRLWRDVTGDSEFAARYFSVLIGLVAVAGVYRLGRELFGPVTGLLAALLLALADLPIDLSQEVRHYGLMVTWAVYSSLFYVQWWRRPSRGNRIGYVLCSIGLLYTHYLGGFVLLAQMVHLLLLARPRHRLFEGLGLWAAVGLGFAPWLPVVLDQNRLRWDNPLYFQNALPNSAETFRAVRTALLGGNYALLGGLGLLGLVYVSYRRVGGGQTIRVRLRPAWPVLYPALWIGLMVGLTVAINARREFLTVRNFVIVVPVLVVLAGHGLANLERVARVFMVALVVVISLTTVDARRHYPDWRAVTRQVTTYHLAGEPVLMDVWVGDFPVRYYIDRQMGPDTPRVSLREWRDVYRGQFLPELLGYVQDYDAVWLVDWGDEPAQDVADVLAEAGFRRTASLTVDHLGTPISSFRYDRMGDRTLVTFGDLFVLRRFHAPAETAPGETLPVALWWGAQGATPLDYSVSVFLLDEAGVLVAQHDGSPLDGVSPTSAWQPGDLHYDYHRLELPNGLAPGSYQLGVKVYWYGDGRPLPVSPGELAGQAWAILGEVVVQE